VVGQQNADIANTLQLWDVAVATVFWLCMGCTLAPPGEYNLTVHVRQRCGLMTNYFDHLLLLTQVAWADWASSIPSDPSSRLATTGLQLWDCAPVGEGELGPI